MAVEPLGNGLTEAVAARAAPPSQPRGVRPHHERRDQPIALPVPPLGQTGASAAEAFLGRGVVTGAVRTAQLVRPGAHHGRPFVTGGASPEHDPAGIRDHIPRHQGFVPGGVPLGRQIGPERRQAVVFIDDLVAAAAAPGAPVVTAGNEGLIGMALRT